MFTTEHFEGRMCYETDKVACIDVHIRPNFDDERPFAFQVYIALDTRNWAVTNTPLTLVNGFSSVTLTGLQVHEEIEQGVLKFLQIRKDLGL